MDAFSDRGSTPLASTLHSHAKWELNRNASWPSFAGHGALLFLQATIGINRNFLCFGDVRDGSWPVDTGEIGVGDISISKITVPHLHTINALILTSYSGNIK